MSAVEKKSNVVVYGDWIYRGLVLAGFTAMMWLNQNFVTRGEFKQAMGDIHTSITQTHNKIDTLSGQFHELAIRLERISQKQAENTDRIRENTQGINDLNRKP